MSFFQKIYELADGADLALNIKRKNDKLTVSVLPSNAKDITPVIITGTPADLDNGFIDTIATQLNKARELQVVASQMEEEHYAKNRAENEAKLKEQRQNKKEAKAKPKEAKKPEPPKQIEPPKPSLF